jgi:protein-L-isoaspartate(D-aspartate) O-methyltransferase
MDQDQIRLKALAMITLSTFILMGGGGCWFSRDEQYAGGNDHPEESREEEESASGAPDVAGGEQKAEAENEEERRFAAARLRMVREQIELRGVRDDRVLEAMRKVPRHRFVPDRLTAFAYEDGPLPIGEGQTISQPYIVALMTELLQAKPGDKILEVGTGSGYQAAVLAEMGAEVHTIEIVEPLAVTARRLLEQMDYPRIRFRVGDGYRGWPEAAPFDGIIVTAAPDHVPRPLVDQLEAGGRMVIPVGAGSQDLLVITRTAEGTARESVIPVRFVPMTGEAMERPH